MICDRLLGQGIIMYRGLRSWVNHINFEIPAAIVHAEVHPEETQAEAALTDGDAGDFGDASELSEASDSHEEILTLEFQEEEAAPTETVIAPLPGEPCDPNTVPHLDACDSTVDTVEYPSPYCITLSPEDSRCSYTCSSGSSFCQKTFPNGCCRLVVQTPRCVPQAYCF